MNWRFEKIDEVTSEDLQRLQYRSLKFPKDRILAGKMNREVISDVPPESFSVLGKRYEGGAAVKIPGILLLPTEPAKELNKVVENQLTQYSLLYIVPLDAAVFQHVAVYCTFVDFNSLYKSLYL